MKDYLEYVRGNSRYSSEFKPGHFEWREDVPDGMEVSTFTPAGTASSGNLRGGSAAAVPSNAAQS